MIQILIFFMIITCNSSISYTNLRKDAVQKFHYEMERCKTSNCIFKTQIWFYKENEKIKMKFRLNNIQNQYKKCTNECMKRMEYIKYRYFKVLKRIEYMKCKRTFQRFILLKREKIVKCLELKDSNCFKRITKEKKKLNRKKNKCKKKLHLLY